MAAKYKLTYFDIRGRADVIRLMFVASGIEFDDVRIPAEDWPQKKPTFPFGRLPVLEIDGTVLPETRAISSYVALETGLYGKSHMEHAQIDVVMEVIRDILLHYSVANVQKDEKAKEEMTKSFFETDCLKFLKWLEGLLVNNNGGDGFFVGDSLTLADLEFYVHHVLILKKNPTALQATPKLEALVSRVENIPKIKAWLPNRPEKYSFGLV